jgi:AcrR family transcriptional regulator
VELLDERGLDGTSLSAIARAAGISKANLYRYFESREAILLAVALAELREWTAALAAELSALAGSGDLEAVADVLATSLARRPRLCALISSLSSVLEHNVSEAVVVDFKRQFAALTDDPTRALHAAVPALSPADARALLTYAYLFVAGAWPSSNPPPVVAQVLAREEFADMCVSFEPTIRAHALTLLRGLTAP